MAKKQASGKEQTSIYDDPVALAALFTWLDARISGLKAEVANLRREVAAAYEDGARSALRVLRLPPQGPVAELARLREVEAAAREVCGLRGVRSCDICGDLAAVADRDSFLCDAHAHLAHVDRQDLPYAPAWRRLRKAVGR